MSFKDATSSRNLNAVLLKQCYNIKPAFLDITKKKKITFLRCCALTEILYFLILPKTTFLAHDSNAYHNIKTCLGMN